MEYWKHIERNPEVCGGQPVIRGTRVPLRTILASIAEGSGVAEILEDYPTLTENDVWAAIAFTAASAEEDLPISGSPR